MPELAGAVAPAAANTVRVPSVRRPAAQRPDPSQRASWHRASSLSSCLTRPRPRAVDLADLRCRLTALSHLEGKRLAVRLPRRSDAAVRGARRFFNVEKLVGVQPDGRRAGIRQLTAGAPAVAVHPDVRRARGVTDGERDVVVARVGPRPNPRDLGDGLRYAGLRVPGLHVAG